MLITAAGMLAGTRLDGDSEAIGEAVNRDRSLAVDPRPLTLDDVAAGAEGPAPEAVLRTWFFAQWGGLPVVVASYLPAVVDRVGAANVAGAYELQRGLLVSSHPRILAESVTDEGVIVTVEVQRRNESPQQHSYTLTRRHDRWYIVFDTVLEEALAAYAQTQRTPGGEQGDPPAAAVRAGLEAASRFRAAAAAVVAGD